MDDTLRSDLAALRSTDGDLRYKAFCRVQEATKTPVPWAYEVWDRLVRDLTHADNHVRAIAAQLLSNLAKSDPEGRIFRDFEALLAVTRDKRFVTARHTMQSLRKIGVAGEKQRALVVNGLAHRFQECIAEKNCTLIRYEICVGLRKLYDEIPDEAIRTKALEVIATEEDLRYRKKYQGLGGSRGSGAGGGSARSTYWLSRAGGVGELDNSVSCWYSLQHGGGRAHPHSDRLLGDRLR